MKMELKKIYVEEINFTSHEGVKYDMDRYTVEMRSPMASHEYTMDIDYINLEISGDVIRYGSWDDMDSEEIANTLELLEREGKLRRPTNSLFKIK